MAQRYLRPIDGILARFAATPRPFHFAGHSRADWEAWRAGFLPRLRELLGPMPESCPLDPEVLSREDMGGYVREKVVFNSERFASVPCWVLVPKTATPEQPAPAMLCLHGHGPNGKDSQIRDPREETPDADRLYKGIAVRLAERGYVCIAPDWRGFGERMDTDAWVRRPGRDGCNVHYLAAGYFGFHALGLQVHDGQRTIDYLQARPEVDGARLGAMGCSFGGTMTTYLSALDDRIGCAVIVCYLSTLHDALVRANFCGAQYMPGLATLADIPDVAGLIAPRPMMAEIGEHDQCFTVDDAVSAYEHVATIYDAAGVPERCAVDRFDGGHEIHAVDSLHWLDKWLAHTPTPSAGHPIPSPSGSEG